MAATVTSAGVPVEALPVAVPRQAAADQHVGADEGFLIPVEVVDPEEFVGQHLDASVRRNRVRRLEPAATVLSALVTLSASHRLIVLNTPEASFAEQRVSAARHAADPISVVDADADAEELSVIRAKVARCRRALMTAATAAGVFAMVAACSEISQLQPYPKVVVENREATAVEIQAQDSAGQFVGFRVPPKSWVGLPSAKNWDLVHRVSEDCTSVSAAAVERRSSPNAIIILALGSLDEYDPEVFLPTPGPLASASVSNLCPQGPHYPGQSPGSH
jgi:hypothetical protein